MKPAPFQYSAPTTVEEAVAVLAEHGDEAKVLAGGQSLVPMMNFRLVRPTHVVDLNRISELAYIRADDGRLRLGALTRQRALERSTLVHDSNRLVWDGVRLIGHPAIRCRGTVGGSVVHADPTAEWPCMLAALDGEVRVVGPRGRRTIGWRELFVSYFTTSLEPDEICEEVVVPALPPDAGWGFEELTHRHGDFAIAGAAAIVRLDAGGRCAQARLAVLGAGPTPLRAAGAEAILTGTTPTPEVLEEAAHAAAKEIEPEADLHASEAYRRHVTRRLTARALERAVERAGSR